jgi:predicted DNA-binding antitoxin AbrB/MazE fold protein
MTSLRLRYENGILIPLDPLPDLKDGDEIEVEWSQEIAIGEPGEMLNRTRGLWADWDCVEQAIDDAREKWDNEWQDRLTSL